MRSVKEWWEELADSFGGDVAMGLNIGGRLRALLESVQADALEQAACLCDVESATWGSVSPATDALATAADRIRDLKPGGTCDAFRPGADGRQPELCCLSAGHAGPHRECVGGKWGEPWGDS